MHDADAENVGFAETDSELLRDALSWRLVVRDAESDCEAAADSPDIEADCVTERCVRVLLSEDKGAYVVVIFFEDDRVVVSLLISRDKDIVALFSSESDLVKLICVNDVGVRCIVLVSVNVAVFDDVLLDSFVRPEVESVSECLETENPLVRETLRDMDFTVVAPVREMLAVFDSFEGRSFEHDTVTDGVAVRSVKDRRGVKDLELDDVPRDADSPTEIDCLREAVHGEEDTSCE